MEKPSHLYPSLSLAQPNSPKRPSSFLWADPSSSNQAASPAGQPTRRLPSLPVSSHRHEGPACQARLLHHRRTATDRARARVLRTPRDQAFVRARTTEPPLRITLATSRDFFRAPSRSRVRHERRPSSRPGSPPLATLPLGTIKGSTATAHRFHLAPRRALSPAPAPQLAPPPPWTSSAAARRSSHTKPQTPHRFLR